jgi:hypothetical protein
LKDHWLQGSDRRQGPPLEENTILVIDTNILLHEFEVLQQFVTEVEKFSLPVTVIIPGIVILELDGYWALILSLCVC